MTFANSFSARLATNFKRRLWVFALSAIGMLFCTLGTLSAYYSRISAYRDRGAYKSAPAYYLAMRQATSDALVTSDYITVITAIVAVIIAIQAFSYQYNKSKLDFYMSQPVSAGRRFSIINIGSLLIYAVPLLLSLTLCCILALTQQAISVAVFLRVIFSFFEYLLFFAAVYFSTLLAVMLTGNLLMTILGTIVFLLYEGMFSLAKEALDYQYLGARDYGFSTGTQNISALAVQSDILTFDLNDTTVALWSKPLIIALLLLVANAVSFCLLSYFAYMHRDAKVSGQSIAYDNTRPWIKVPVAVLSTLIISTSVYSSAEKNEVLMLTSIIIISILTGAVIQILFDMNIASAFKSIPSTLTVCIISVVIYGGYYFDITGFNHYVPNEEKLVSCAIAFPNSLYDSNWYFTDSRYRNTDNAYAYLRENMKIEDPETIIALADNSIPSSDAYSDNSKDYLTYSILYRLKNGRCIARSMAIDINDLDNQQILDRLFSNSAYNNCINPFINSLGIENAEYIQGITFNQIGCTTYLNYPYDQLAQALRQDITQNYSFNLVRHSKKIGTISVSYPAYNTVNIDVYPEYTNTLTLLGVSANSNPNHLDAGGISYIKVVYYEADDNSSDDNYDYAIASDYDYNNHTATYTDARQIEEILNTLVYDDSLTCWSDRSHKSGEYSVVICLNTPYTSAYPSDNTVYAGFNQNQIPDFVIADTN